MKEKLANIKSGETIFSPSEANQLRAGVLGQDQWFPGIDMAFVIDIPGNPQDQLCNFLFVCFDNSLPNHIVAKPIPGAGYTSTPVLLQRVRYRFSEGTEAMHTLGLKEDVVQAIKQRNNAQSKLDS